jgi:hypothetical protein
MRTLDGADPLAVADEPDGPAWHSVFSGLDQKYPTDRAAFRGTLSLTGPLSGTISLLLPPLGEGADVFFNGKKVAGGINLGTKSPAIPIDATALLAGDNNVMVLAKPFEKPPRSFDYTSPGSLLAVGAVPNWERKAFNGLAAAIVQATDSKGTIVLTASGPGLNRFQQVIVVH